MKLATIFASVVILGAGCAERQEVVESPSTDAPSAEDTDVAADDVEDDAATDDEPPAAQAETPPPPPGPTYVWVGGRWHWRGRWVWVPGRYLVARPGAVWVEGRWVRRHRHRYVWVRGHWRR